MLIYKNKSLIFQPAAPEQSNTEYFTAWCHLNIQMLHFIKCSFLGNPEAVLLWQNCFDNSNSERMYD